MQLTLLARRHNVDWFYYYKTGCYDTFVFEGPLITDRYNTLAQQAVCSVCESGLSLRKNTCFGNAGLNQE